MDDLRFTIDFALLHPGELATVDVIVNGVHNVATMTAKEIRLNIREFGEHPELVRALKGAA